MIKKLYIILLCLVINLSAQSLLEPVGSSVYSFLLRMSQKGIIQFNDEIIPLERILIFERLKEILKKRNLLSISEIEDTEYFLKDFKLEKDIIKNFSSEDINYFQDNSGRYRLLNYSNDKFRLNVDPVFGVSFFNYYSDSFKKISTGLKFNGYIADKIGFSFNYNDNSTNVSGYSKKINISNETGTVWNEKDYAEINTHISYGWNWGNLTVGKEFLNWGYGESGKLVLSNRAPSFPFINLNLRLSDWLSFNYIHAWLSSKIIDSNEVYASTRQGYNREMYREKYLASHTLIIRPFEGLSVSLGESIVYSDRLEISYLMPLMFFRLADHYLSNNNNDAGSNSQFFLGVSSKNYIKNTQLYGTLFIDEISIGDLFDAERERNQLGFTLGGSVVDIPINDLKITAEFTKIYPFVYRHYIPTQTYESSGYLLGHWMGHNSDQIYFALDYRILRGLHTKLWFQRIRKGGEGVVEMQYVRPSQPFLFGSLNKYNYFGIKINYEIIHTGYVFADIQFIKNEFTDSSINKTNNIKDMTFGFSYGL